MLVQQTTLGEGSWQKTQATGGADGVLRIWEKRRWDEKNLEGRPQAGLICGGVKSP